MNMMKKLIAAISSLAMIATMTSAVIVHAEDQVVFTPVLQETSEKGVYDLAINVDTTQAKGNFVYSLQFAVTLDDTVFDLDNGPNKTETITGSGRPKTVYPNREFTDQFGNGTVQYQSSDKTLNYVFSASNEDAAGWVSNGAIATFKNLKLLSNVTTDDIDILFNGEVTIDAGNSLTDYTSYSSITGNLVLGKAKFPGNKKSVVVPTNDSDSVNESTIKTIKPSDVGGTGDVWANADSSENAVAGLANFTPAAETTPTLIEWTIKATSVGGEAASYTKTFDLGASIDAAATIGLIVNYNTAEYSSVSIVSGALK